MRMNDLQGMIFLEPWNNPQKRMEAETKDSKDLTSEFEDSRKKEAKRLAAKDPEAFLDWALESPENQRIAEEIAQEYYMNHAKSGKQVLDIHPDRQLTLIEHLDVSRTIH